VCVKEKGDGVESQKERARGEVVRAAGSVSLGILLSRLVGLLRDVVIAFAFGAGLATDAFFVAFRVPNLIRRLMGEGPMSSAFIPVFTEYREKRSSGEVWRLTASFAGLMGTASLLISIAGVVAAPLVVRIMAPSWGLGTAQGELATDLTRILFPYLFLVVLYALAMAVLNACGRFFVPAMATALLNFGMIFGALALAPLFERPVLGLAWGVLLGGLLQFGVNIPSLRAVGVSWRPRFETQHEGVRRIGRLMGPTVVGLAVKDVNILVDTILATFLAGGSVTWLFYANRLTEFPLGLIGIAVGTAILPTLSQQTAREDMAEMKRTVAFGLRVVFFLSFPALVGLAVLRTPIAALIFERGAFSAADTAATASAILYYALGMWAAGGIRILASAFYSLKDTKTPFQTALAAMFINIALNLILMRYLAHSGLALASSLSLVFQFVLLLHFLRRSIGPLGFGNVMREGGKALLAAAVMGLACGWSLTLLPGASGAGLAMKAGIVFGEIAAGMTVFLVMAKLMGMKEYAFLRDMLATKMKGRG
jgi:putative peptidoglycan lipid II flippase